MSEKKKTAAAASKNETLDVIADALHDASYHDLNVSASSSIVTEFDGAYAKASQPASAKVKK